MELFVLFPIEFLCADLVYNLAMLWDELKPLLEKTLAARRTLPEWENPHSALRLFNGFYEGYPDLVVDRYGGTLVIFDYAQDPHQIDAWLEDLRELFRISVPDLHAGMVKSRRSHQAPHPENPALYPAGAMDGRRGILAWGEKADTWIEENGVSYALELGMNQDASFYLDTRGLRGWLKENATGRRVLNTFAYTGSLGVAALAGGAAQVVQLDLSRRFLGIARRSAQLNHAVPEKHQLRPGNFFKLSSQMRRDREEFDLVILDPPFFASSGQGSLDLNQDSLRMINKVRPLVADGGWLVVVNNALFVSGAQFQTALDDVCAGGYLRLETRLDVPPDVTGFAETICSRPPTDPAPFNHPTKVAVLSVRKKN